MKFSSWQSVYNTRKMSAFATRDWRKFGYRLGTSWSKGIGSQMPQWIIFPAYLYDGLRPQIRFRMFWFQAAILTPRFRGVVGYHVSLTHWRSPVRVRAKPICSFLILFWRCFIYFLSLPLHSTSRSMLCTASHGWLIKCSAKHWSLRSFQCCQLLHYSFVLSSCRMQINNKPTMAASNIRSSCQLQLFSYLAFVNWAGAGLSLQPRSKPRRVS